MDFISPWWAAWLAAGAVGAAIPVVIHMIHQTRAPIVPFPTLRFLRSASERTARRRKIENLFLMILRMLLFALLAFALSRPFLSSDFSLLGEQSSSAAVLILDNSYSMNVRGEAGTRFARVKQEARAILESPFKPTEAAVLLTNPRGEARPKWLSSDRAQLFRRIDDARVWTGRADLVSAVRHAYSLLDKARAAERRLWILTDRQALSWEGLEDLKAPATHPDVPVAVIRPTEPSMANVAITGAEVVSRDRTVGLPVRIDVTVANTGRTRSEQRNILLFADDFTRPRAKQAVRLSAAGTPGGSKTLSLTHVFEQPGPHRVRVALEGKDALALDDARRLALTIAEAVPVLAVRQKEADVPLEDANFYLVRALDPVGAASDFPWAIRPEERTADTFSADNLSRYAVVFLNNVGTLTAPVARSLTAYVAAGGTLVIFCGPQVSAETYNRLLVDGVPREGGLLPARLGDRMGDAVLRNTVEKITQVQAGSPYLKDLVHAAEIYQDVLVYEYFQVFGATSESVLARLSNGDPLLLAKPFGRGHVLLCTTPPPPTGPPFRSATSSCRSWCASSNWLAARRTRSTTSWPDSRSRSTCTRGCSGRPSSRLPAPSGRRARPPPSSAGPTPTRPTASTASRSARRGTSATTRTGWRLAGGPRASSPPIPTRRNRTWRRSPTRSSAPGSAHASATWSPASRGSSPASRPAPDGSCGNTS